MLNKAATSLSLLFAVLLLLSLPGESKENTTTNTHWGKTPGGLSLTPANTPANPATATPTAGFSYSQWLSSGQPLADENWSSGTFIFRPTAAETYQSRLSAAWRDAAARAWDVQPLLRDELLLRANNKASNWQAAWQNHQEAALLGLVDGTTDALIGGILADGRSLSWVRSLEVDFRTKLGNRPGSFGIDAIIALKEEADRATGLQLRGFFGNNLKGANAGIFYRQAKGNNLLGGNIFLDYENTDKGGDFWRWSVGGEWRSPYAELTGNRYIGITERQRGSDGLYYYTADGTEIELALKSPKAPWLSGILSYYKWDGEYGDADDTGFRYGIRVDRRLGGLSFELEYEDPEKGNNAWGGRINYTHDFGNGAESTSTPESLTFDPRAHFFDSVRREYTQRIRKTGNVLTGRIIITQVNGQATLIGSELSLKIAGDGQNFTTELALIDTTTSGGVTTAVTGTIVTTNVTATNHYTIIATALVTAFTQSPATLGLSVNDWAIELHSQLAFLHDSPTMTLVEGQLEINRNDDNGISEIVLTNGITLKLTNNALISVATGPTATLVLTSGMVSLVLNAGNTLNAMVGDGTLIVSVAASAGIAASVGSIASGEIRLISDGATTNIVPLIVSLINPSVVVATGYTGLVAQITTTGGSNNREYSLITGSGTFAIGATDGLLSLTLAQNSPATLTALVQASDAGTIGVKATPVTVGFTLLVGGELKFSPDKTGITIATYDNNIALLTATVTGQLSVINYAIISTAPAGFAANFAVSASGIISLQQAVTTATTLSVYIRASEQLGSGVSRAATLLLTVAALDPSAFAATLDNTAPVLITGASGLVASINSTGGGGTHTYTFQSGGGDFTVAPDGSISLLIARADPITLSAIIIANDGHPNTPAVSLSLTLNIVNVLNFTPSKISLLLTTYGTAPVALLTVTAVDPLSGNITYSLLSTAPASFSSINFTPANRVISLTATLTAPLDVSVYILASTDTEQATLTVQLKAVEPPAFAAVLNNAAPAIITGAIGLVAQVNPTGGAGTYTYTIQPATGNLTIGTNGSITLLTAVATAAALAATVVANDGHPNTPPVTLSLTLAVSESSVFIVANAYSRVINTYAGSVALITSLSPNSQFAVSFGDTNFAVGATDGVLSLKASISTPTTITASGTTITASGTTITASVLVSDSSSAPVVTLGYTLNIGACSFFLGCQPSVNYNGATHGILDVDSTSNQDWEVISAPLAQSLIAAGADPNERISGDEPLFAAVRYGGTIPLISVLLATASVNAVGLLTDNRGDNIHRSGVYYYAFTNRSTRIFAKHEQLFSLFIAHGADINYQRASTPVGGGTEANAGTPLDDFIFARHSESQFIIAAGGKCAIACTGVSNSGLLAITLTAVSFSPATVTESTAVQDVGSIYTVQAATGEGNLFNYRVVSTFPASVASRFSAVSLDANSAALNINSYNNIDGLNISVYIEVDDHRYGTSQGKATLEYVFEAKEALRFEPNNLSLPPVTTNISVPVALHTVAEAIDPLNGTRTYALVSTAPAGFTNNINFTAADRVISLTAALTTTLNASIYIRATTATEKTTLILQLQAVNPPVLPSFGSAYTKVVTTHTGAVATITSPSANSQYSVSFGGSNFAVGASDGILSLNTSFTTATTVTASVVVSDSASTPLVTLGYVLNIGPCSFFTGCQPLVNFAGTGAPAVIDFRLKTNANWEAIDVPLAQSLIDAGVDVNEKVFGDRPLFALGRFHTNTLGLAVISLLLDNDANVSLGGGVAVDAGRQERHEDTGVIFNALIAGPATHISSQLSLLIANGANINRPQIRINDVPATLNVLLADNFTQTNDLVDILRSFGFKCRIICNLFTGNPLPIFSSISFASGTVIATVADTATLPIGDLYTVIPATGLGTLFSYRIVSTAPPLLSQFFALRPPPLGSNSSILSLTMKLDAQNLSVFIEVIDQPSGDKATLQYVLNARKALHFAQPNNNLSLRLTTNGTVPVALHTATAITLSGGGGAIDYTLLSTAPANFADNINFTAANRVISLTATLSTPVNVSVYIRATTTAGKATLTLQLNVVSPANFANANSRVVNTYAGAVASIIAPANSQFSVVVGGLNFTVGASDGILSLKASISTPTTTITASVRVSISSSTPLITLGYTLNTGACSFLLGCQPVVDYDGARHGSRDSGVNLKDWAGISATVAQSLIAAGADVNERISGDEPLLAAVRYAGTIPLISVLLAATADVNAVGNLLRESTLDDFYQEGVFHYIGRSSDSGFANELASIFIAASANVNLQLSNSDASAFPNTPLDIFDNSLTLNITLIIAAGGKCSTRCSSISGAVSLATVTFNPTALTITSVGATQTGALHTVQAASGLGTSFNYQLLSVHPASLSTNFSAISLDVNRTALSINTALGGTRPTITVYIETTDNNTTNDKATLRINITE